MEAITVALHLVEVQSLQCFTAEALEAACRIADWEARHDTGIDVCAIAEDKAAEVPVHHADAAILVAATENEVCIFGGFQKAVQVCRCMAEVGIHLEHAFVIAFERPLEAHHVSGTKSHLPLTAKQVDSGILVGFGLDKVARTVRGTVIHHQNFQTFILFQNGRHDKQDILLLIVGRNNHQTLRELH